ncbi:MAG: very short patch repair endonuclease [Desulfomonile sp.]|nr:very short patch repair endonuclease [Desulfomonile sp.]
MEKRLREKLPLGGFNDVSPIDSARQKAVRGTGNRSTELRLRAGLVRAGVAGWKVRPKPMRGNPDFVFLEQKIAVFVDGCFWHGCPSCGHVPSKNRAFWEAKLQRNRERDRAATADLTEKGFLVLRFWEHELRDDLGNCLNRIRVALTTRTRSGCKTSDWL